MESHFTEVFSLHPPPFFAMQWYYSKNGAQCGPVDDTELRRLARSGEITPVDLLWNATMGVQWQPASSFNFLFFQPVDLQPPAIPSESESTKTAEAALPTSNRILMGRARASLKGRWGMAVLATITYLAIIESPQFVKIVATPQNSALSQLQLLMHGFHQPVHQAVPTHGYTPLGTIISLFVSLLMVFIGNPIFVGVCSFFLNLSKRRETKVSDLFVGFRSGASYYWKIIGASLLLGLIIIGWVLLLLVLPIAIVMGVAFFNHLLVNPWLHPVIVVMALVGMMALIRVIYSYKMTFFILADETNIRAIDSIRRSKIAMRGNRWKLFMLQLRFLGWSLLALLTCGIGFLWVIPYIQTATAHFYLDVKERESLPNV